MKKSREQVKAELMRKMEEGLDKVMDWQEAHAKFTLTELEDFVLALREEMGEEIAEAVMGQMESKQTAEVLRCEMCGKKLVYKGQEEKHLETRMGGIRVERGRYWCPECEAGIFPPG